jgi:hypothetical protein
MNRICRINNQWPEATDCISHRQRRVKTFCFGFRLAQLNSSKSQPAGHSTGAKTKSYFFIHRFILFILSKNFLLFLLGCGYGPR